MASDLIRAAYRRMVGANDPRRHSVCRPGVLAIVTPPARLAAIMVLIASFALASGVMLLVGAFRLSAAKAAVTEPVHAG